jgi:hypothetical protein
MTTYSSTKLSPTAWLNIARCAGARADAKTFNWDEDDSPLGDLITREMARMLAYRCALIENLLQDVRCTTCTKFE